MIEVSQADGVATLTLADGRPLTKHDVPLGLALRDGVRDAADSDDIKAIIIRASSRDFCPAVPVTELAAAARCSANGVTPPWHEAYAAVTGLYQNVCYCKKIVITAVGGQCAGAGSLLVLCSDLTVATPEATFESPFGALPEANLVLAAITMRLNRAKGWLLGGGTLTAQEAFDAGLINAIVARDALDGEARKLARAVTRMPLDGIAMSKINVETCLDAQGVGREFDMAGFYTGAMQGYWDELAAGGRT